MFSNMCANPASFVPLNWIPLSKLFTPHKAKMDIRHFAPKMWSTTFFDCIVGSLTPATPDDPDSVHMVYYVNSAIVGLSSGLNICVQMGPSRLMWNSPFWTGSEFSPYLNNFNAQSQSNLTQQPPYKAPFFKFTELRSRSCVRPTPTATLSRPSTWKLLAKE